MVPAITYKPVPPKCIKVTTSTTMVSVGTVQPSLNQEFLCTLACQIIVQQILLFFGGKNTYTTLLGPTRLLIFEKISYKT